MRVELQRLTRRFGTLTALRDVTCTIPSGCRAALIGPNGSGKSTLNRILMGLLRFEGEVRLDGCSRRGDRLEIARQLAYAPQAAPNLSARVSELVASLGATRGLSPARVSDIAARLGMDVDEAARRPFRALSGGTKQKLLLALALASDASLLVLDEPTASLDRHSREQLGELIEELAGDATLLLCSHRLEEVRGLVDHVLVLEEGRLVFDGPAAGFLADSRCGPLLRAADGDAAH